MDTRSRVHAMRAALAEAGYPKARVNALDDEVWVSLWPSPDGVPLEVCWMAFFVLGLMDMCWPCWSAGHGEDDCDHDPITSPRPFVRRSDVVEVAP